MRQSTARNDQKFEGIVKRRGITAKRTDDRVDLFDIVPEKLMRHLLFTGPHPVKIPAQGIDLAVMRQHPVRMGQRPRRKCIGAVTGMDQGKR